MVIYQKFVFLTQVVIDTKDTFSISYYMYIFEYFHEIKSIFNNSIAYALEVRCVRHES